MCRHHANMHADTLLVICLDESIIILHKPIIVLHILMLVLPHYVSQGHTRQLWKAGSLPLGWATFYNRTVILDRRWHKLGLGHEAGVGHDGVEQAAVLHYDGVMKPWLDIGIGKYKSYWSKHINYDHPYLQQCNIHE